MAPCSGAREVPHAALGHGFNPFFMVVGLLQAKLLAVLDVGCRLHCIREALPDESAPGLIEIMRQHALTPVPEIGYA